MNKCFKEIFSMILLFIVFFCFGYFCFHGSADSSYFDYEGSICLECSSYEDDRNIFNTSSMPVLSDSVSIPSNYRLVAYFANRNNTYKFNYWVYGPSDSIPFFYKGSDGSSLHFGYDDVSCLVVSNRFNSSNDQIFNYTQYYQPFSLGSGKGVCFVPFYDSDGDLYVPDSLPQFHLNLLSLSDQLHYNVSNVSSDVGSIDYYLFPSSFPDSGGAVRNLISSPVSISEIPASVYYEIENDCLAYAIDSGFDAYNSVHGLMPAITFYSESSVSRLNRIFDASSYSLPYIKLGTFNINSTHFGSSGGGQYLDLNKIANSSSGVYAYDNLCIIAVAHKDDRDYLARVDFSVSSLRNSSVVPPSDIIDSNTYQGGIVTDLQELAMYIKYLFENSDENLSIEFHNFTAYLQHIPWNSIVEQGVYFGLSDVIPKLQQLEFDTDFDLPALIDDLTPLLASNQLSLPDLTGALAPFFNNFDISPTGNFGTLLSNMDNNLNGHLDSLFTDLSTSVTDLSTEINNNTRTIFVPDFDDMETRLELSGDRLSNKFGFVDDVKDNLEDVRDTIANSSETPPDWHFTVFGVQLFLVDWSVYEPYRGTVKNIFVCIAYILLFKHIYKTIPLNGGDDS